MVKPAGSVSTEDFKAAMASFAAGVTIVTTLDRGGRPAALTATAFSSLSATPPLCLVCVNKRASAHAALRERRRFAVNVLCAAQAALSAKFAAKSADKFADVAWRPGSLTGCPIIEGALSRFECELVEVYDGGDHDIFVGALLSVEVSDGKPLVYWRGDYASLRRPDAHS